MLRGADALGANFGAIAAETNDKDADKDAFVHWTTAAKLIAPDMKIADFFSTKNSGPKR